MEKNNCHQLSEEQGQALLKLARHSILKRLGKPLSEVKIKNIEKSLEDEKFNDLRGVFVTLRQSGKLRGCIGTLTGTESIKDGVQRNALNAAFSDYRFSALTGDEIAEVDIEVSILSEPEILLHENGYDLLRKLKPGIDGVILKKGSRSATFLPQVWDQVPNGADFLSHLAVKAGLAADVWKKGDVEIQIYHVHCFHEKK